VKDWELRLEELGVSGSMCNLRVSDGGRMVSTVGERDAGLVERDEQWSTEIGWERRTRLDGERIDERGVEGQP
jgi:hypothetical protein